MTQPSNQPFELPQWMREPEKAAQGPGHTKLHFLRGTLRRIAELFENDFSSEKYARFSLYLQSVDPRAKLAVFLLFIIFGSFMKSVPALLLLAAVPLFFAAVSGLELKTFARRVWGYLPLLLFVLSLPGASNAFVRGTPLITILPEHAAFFPNGLYFTSAGLWSAAKIGLRAGVSLSFAALLLLTTRWPSLTGALSAFGMPAMLVSVLNMAYRYLFVMARTASDLMQARFLRTCGTLPAKKNRRFMGHSIAFLFLKSHYYSEEIYSAMCCRGYAGGARRPEKRKLNRNDAVFLGTCVLIFLILLAEELLF